jgi:osmotically-inducible protein OsmY
MHAHRGLAAAILAAALTTETGVVAQDTAPSVTTTNRNPMTPDDIRNAVEDELLSDPGVRSNWISVSLVGGVVTLTGTVDNLLARDRAALVAETVKGVESVVNRISVEPAMPRSSEQLRRDVRAALASNPATDAYEVSVTVDHAGAVTLSGQVDSWAERRLSGRVARGVAGVTELHNDVTVRPAASRHGDRLRRDGPPLRHGRQLLREGPGR